MVAEERDGGVVNNCRGWWYGSHGDIVEVGIMGCGKILKVQGSLGGIMEDVEWQEGIVEGVVAEGEIVGVQEIPGG